MRKDAQASRAALLDAARRLVAERGPEVPLTLVAAEAGVGIGTLYRHFPRREDLVLGLVHDLLGRVREVTRAAAEAWDTAPADAWPRYVHDLAGLRVAAVLAPLADAGLAEALPASVLTLRRSVLGEIDGLLARAREAGLVREGVDAMHFTLALAAAVRPLPRRAFEEVHDAGEFLLDLLLRGLRPDPTGPEVG